MATTLVRLAITLSVGASVAAVAVPSFLANLQASKFSEPVDALARIGAGAVGHAEVQAHEIAFPPSVELTPAEVPRATRVETREAWSHLTWRALGFSMTTPHAFSYRFDSQRDPATDVFRFAATAHGDLDGDGNLSTFQLQGDKALGSAARLMPGLLIDREVE